MKPFKKAAWIYHLTGVPAGAQSKYGNPCPYFRKEFSVKTGVKKATLKASAAGVFKAYINGKDFGDYMSPGWTDYRRRIPLMTFDATDMLARDNAIVIVAGDGWFSGCMGGNGLRNSYGSWNEVIAELKIEYGDGTVEYVSTGTDWRANEGVIRRSDIYMGETVDYAFYNGDIYRPGFDDSDWARPRIGWGDRTALLDEQSALPTVVKHVVKPVSVTAKNGRTIYDFGQNLVGVVRFTAKSEGYGQVVVRHAEMLFDDGSLYTDNYRSAESIDRLILRRGETVDFRPLFTFHGFRYAEIHVPSGQAEVSGVRAEVMYSDLAETADFTCSDELVNRLYRNIVWGQRGNFLNIPTDCPQRDERLGWTGDSQVFCGTAVFNMDCRAFYRKYMLDLMDAQAASGAVPGVVPVLWQDSINAPVTGFYAAGWGDVITVLPHVYYAMYGDKEAVHDILPAMTRYVRYLVRIADDYILPAEPNYGDWLNVNAPTDKSLLHTAFGAYSAALTADLARAVGENDGFPAEQAEAFRTAFRRTFMQADGTLTSHTQTAYLLAYAFGLMTKDEVRAPLRACFAAADDRITVGFLGVKFVLPVLCELGETELAYKILTSREYPGWLYSVVNGATTIWERWDGYTKERGFGDVEMNSYNHYSCGSCGEWMFKYCLGIRPEAGFERLTLRPYIDTSGRLTHAEGHYDSVKGRIEVAWRTDGNKTTYSARVPKGIELTVDAPKGVTTMIERY